MHILDILTVCFRKKLLMITIPLFSAVVGYIASYLVPVAYYTEIRLRVDDPVSEEMSMLPNIGKNLTEYFGKTTHDQSEELYLEILQGRENLVAVIKELSLDTIYDQPKMDLKLKSFSKDLKIDHLENNIITCGYTSTDRDLAVNLTRFITQRANKRFLEVQKERIALSTNFLKDRQKQLIDSLEVLSEGLITFYRDNNVINIQKQVELTLLALASYEEDINKIKAGERLSRRTTGIGTPINNELNSKLKALQNEFMKIRGTYNSDYKPPRNSVLINTDWGLDKMLTEQIMTSKIGLIKEFLMTLSKELALSEAQLAKNVPAIQVIQEPYYPDWKVSPKRSIWVLVAFSLSLFGFVSYVLTSAFLKGELENYSEVHRQKIISLVKALK